MDKEFLIVEFWNNFDRVLFINGKKLADLYVRNSSDYQIFTSARIRKGLPGVIYCLDLCKRLGVSIYELFPSMRPSGETTESAAGATTPTTETAPTTQSPAPTIAPAPASTDARSIEERMAHLEKLVSKLLEKIALNTP